MNKYELTTQHTISTGESITIVIDEDDISLIAFTSDGRKIGNIDLTEYDECYYIRWMYLDQLGSTYTNKGIGRASLIFFKEVFMCSLTAAENNGMQKDDGSHLTGDAPAFIAKMRKEGIVC